MKRLIITCLLTLASACFAPALFAWTKSGTTYTTNGSQSDVSAAIARASVGDTVNIPAGSFTWGAGGAFVSVKKAITLSGAGPTSTTINISSAGPRWGSGVISISAAAVVGGFTMTQSGLANTTALSGNSVNGWRITNIIYNSGATAGYFVYAGSYGLIDSCTVNGGAGSDEWIFARGPDDSWQTPSSLGTANAVYVEKCILNRQGYTDFNANSRAVVRFCTINPTVNYIKLDAHGFSTNRPPRSFRHIEFYGNHWTGYSQVAFEIRGGTGMVFDNIYDSSSGGAIFLDDYEVNYRRATVADYPIKDQVGVGMDPKAAHSEPMYLWNNLQVGVNWPASPFCWGQSMAGVINFDRDYYGTVSGFDGSSGVGRGVKADISPGGSHATASKAGVGYWVTDEGNWNTTVAANTSGQLYSWNGSAWVLKYTPYTYPHPLRTAASAGSSRRSR